METKITATELAKNLSDVLNRINYRGERFIIERNGERLASLGPAGATPGMTVTEFLERLLDVPWPDDDFGRDLEAIQASQPKAVLPEWRP